HRPRRGERGVEGVAALPRVLGKYTRRGASPGQQREGHPAAAPALLRGAPQAAANSAKSIGCRSQPYSGLPRKTICSHLICPSVPFFTHKTFTGSRDFTQAANSP